ncbi:homoserine/homoserine lactone efflux protein [Roseibium hamelinense]|uniref:Homoserine/homoserine lactone efflux protein n=1 Tax=Roseibium hamelinense TaxID=150831 RepID=A0A562TAQ3_9HYPH|nr:LysE family translocator [Roseibium hamelinense]MTI45365.1 LysE family translocator [Roseibium hamelinense]TWI90264.1 homoserine/homoserine lactone efflux protein [Roseibium hamelinense]
MPLETWLLFILVALVPAISPGPAVLLAISNTLRFGRNATLASATGNAIGLIVLGFAVAFGFGAIMATSALAFTVLKFAGAAYLIYLGTKVWRDKTGFNTLDGALCTRKSHSALFIQALAVSVTNPKAILVISALFPQFMSKSGIQIDQVVILSLTYAALCWLNHAAIAVAGNHLRRFIISPKRMRLARRITGGLFVGFGAAMAAASR